MIEIIVYDAGEEAGEKRYTVLIGKKAFILGTLPDAPFTVDEKSIQTLSLNEVDSKYMDKACKKIPIALLPECIIVALRKRL